MATQRTPTSNRVPKKGGKTVTLKMSMGKKTLDDDPDLARMMYQFMVINGKQYCRPHLLVRCHLCAQDGNSVNMEVEEERQKLGLRPSGDKLLNKRAQKWGNLTSEKLLQQTLEIDLINAKYGSDHLHTNPEQWQQYKTKCNQDERALNDEFLADTPQVGQCCYWACEAPDAEKLLTCSGCGIVKYCSKDHQAKDWVFEHKGECRIPDFLKEEYEADRIRNLAGDYSEKESG